jgi:hypothetical protein
MIPRYAPVPRSASPSSSARPRGLALLVAALALAALVLGTGVVVRPLWWRLKADLSEHGPEQHSNRGGAGSGNGDGGDRALPTTAAPQPAKMAAALEAMAGGGKGGGQQPSSTNSKVRMDNKAGETPAAVAAAAKAAEEAAAGAGGDDTEAATAEDDNDDDKKATKPPPAGPMDDAARQALLERLAKMTPQQLERAREQAREQQWDDEWWRQYQKAEKSRREQLAKQTLEQEKRTVARFNLTLNQETAKRLAHPDGGYVFVTWANSHYTDFALSWAHHLTKAGLGAHLLVGAMDDPVLYSLAKRRIGTFAMQSGEWSAGWEGEGARAGVCREAKVERPWAPGARTSAHPKHTRTRTPANPPPPPPKFPSPLSQLSTSLSLSPPHLKTIPPTKPKASPRATSGGAAKRLPRWDDSRSD